MNILKIIKNNLIFILLSISLVSSAIVPIENGELLYAFGLGIIFIVSIYYSKLKHIDYKYLLFYLVCILSSIGNLVFDVRLFIFGLLLFCSTPITNSLELFRFRHKYIYYCLLIFPFIAIINYYCFNNNINYYDIASEGDFRLNFSGLFPHPMWLAAATGIANQVLLWIFLNNTKKNKLLAALSLIGFLMSFYITIIAASRIAVLASILSSVVMLYLTTKKIKRFLIYLLIAGIVALISLPTIYKASKRMQMKVEYSEGKYGSRTPFIEEGFEHLEETPIFGVGFATQYINHEKRVGRIESGSGWLSILFQLGIAGSIIMLLILKPVIKTLKYAQKNKNQHLILFCSVFVFLCTHSCFEGYILTPGYYPCILFWTILGYLTTYPKYLEGKFETKYKILERLEWEKKLMERKI